MLRASVLGLTFLTGFTGLAYEVTWQKYLAVLLGAHSEATAAVLGLFLGGLSIGYWLFGALTRRIVERGRESGQPISLLVVYGAVEAGIGAYCVLFPGIFAAVRGLSLLLPTGVGALGFAVDVVLAALLILPPATLMGGTIPILTQALSRSLDDATRLHAYVYAFNTAGAFAGALTCGFALIHWMGLEGVMLAMGIVNLCVGAVLVLLGMRHREVAWLDPDATPKVERSAAPAIYGFVALLLGFSMMVFQTIIIRVGGLSLGSSEYTFSMVVAVFVLCIALGSAGVSLLPRVGRHLLPSVLWALTLLFGALYFALETGPYWAHVVRSLFRDQAAGFPIYWAAVFVALLLAIGLPVVLGGATLPLLFHSLKREVGDLGARAGRLYSLNTVGSLAGALLGGYALLFWLDLHHVYRIGVAVLVLAAALVSLMHYPKLGFVGAAALLLVPIFAVGALPAWSTTWLASGTFRTRQPSLWSYEGPSAMPRGNRHFVFYDDDPISSVAVQEFGRPGETGHSRSILVNGKSDGNTLGDYPTMAMAALVPALLAERAQHSFVIGYGTGITAGELAVLDEAESVTVAEISPGVVAAAPLFDFSNHGASKHPKIEIIRSDAYRALLKGRRQYDVIVSEPSNPWVTGTEMLFSTEFLAEARDRLSPGGVYCQWFHVYETSDEAIELVLRTYASVFDHVAVWSVQGSDLLLLGVRNPEQALDVERLIARMARPDFSAGFDRLGIDGPAQLMVHEQLPLDVVNAAPLEGPVHSLYWPRLSFVAGRGFFVGGLGRLPSLGFGEMAAIGGDRSLLRRALARFEGHVPQQVGNRLLRHACAASLPNCWALFVDWRRSRPGQRLPNAIADLEHTRQLAKGFDELEGMLDGSDTAPVTPAVALERSYLFMSTTTPVLPLDPRTLVRLWDRCTGGPEAIDQCARGRYLAQRVAQGESVPPTDDWLALIGLDGAPADGERMKVKAKRAKARADR